MQRLVWVDSGGVRCFGCAGCKWTYPVQEFSPEFSEAELVEDFHDHSCDDPRFRDKTAAESLPSLQLGDSDRPSVDSKRILQDLCGLKGAVLASIESLPSDDPGTDGLEQIKAELDRVRSLLWLAHELLEGARRRAFAKRHYCLAEMNLDEPRSWASPTAIQLRTEFSTNRYGYNGSGRGHCGGRVAMESRPRVCGL